MSGIVFRHAKSDADIVASFPVLHQLRPHLVDQAETLARVRRQQEEGYRLLLAMDVQRRDQ